MQHMHCTAMMLLSSCCALHTARTSEYISEPGTGYICKIKRRLFSGEKQLIIDDIKRVAWQSSET